MGRPVASCLAGLLVDGVAAIPRAELLHLDPLTVVHLVLGRDVIPPLARLTGQRDLDALIVSCHGDSLVPTADGRGSDVIPTLELTALDPRIQDPALPDPVLPGPWN